MNDQAFPLSSSYMPATACGALRALDAITLVTSQDPDLQSLYGVIHREVSKVMECSTFYVCRYDGHGALDFVYMFDEGVLEATGLEPLGNGPTSYCIHNRQPFILTPSNAEIHAHSQYLGQRRPSLSAIHVPLLVAGEPIGVISAQSYLPSAYNESHVRLLCIIAAKAAGSIQNAELRERNHRHERRLRRLAHDLRVREQSLKSVGDLVMTCDSEGYITAYNQAVCDALGCGPHEMAGQNIIVLGISEPGGWPAFLDARNRHIAVTAKDGRTVPIVYSTEPLHDDNDGPAGYLVVGRNLSELQRAEEAGRAALALERHRISRDLHDGLVQSLAIAQMQVKLLLRDHALDGGARDDLGALRETLTRGLAEARQYIVDLKHAYVESDGLVRATRRYAGDFGRVAGLRIEVDANMDDSPLGDADEVHLFYVLREALSNVRKHAEATRVRVVFRREPESFSMCVEDDGRGFDVAMLESTVDPSEHWGLPHIRERAQALGGRAEIMSRPGQGTRICVHLPTTPEPSARAS